MSLSTPAVATAGPATKSIFFFVSPDWTFGVGRLLANSFGGGRLLGMCSELTLFYFAGSSSASSDKHQRRDTLFAPEWLSNLKAIFISRQVAFADATSRAAISTEREPKCRRHYSLDSQRDCRVAACARLFPWRRHSKMGRGSCHNSSRALSAGTTATVFARHAHQPRTSHPLDPSGNRLAPSQLVLPTGMACSAFK